MNQHTQFKRSFTCENCGTNFRWPSHLARHEPACHRRTLRIGKSTQFQRSYVCERCGKTVQSSTTLAHHKCSRSGGKVNTNQNALSKAPYTCGLCGKNFRWPSDLARHEPRCCRRMLRTGKSTQSQKSYVCDMCGKKVQSFTTLAHHKCSCSRGNVNTNQNSPSKTCGLCGKNFRWPSDLARHEPRCCRRMLRTGKSTQSQKSYVCDMCGEKVQSFTNLAHHKCSCSRGNVNTNQNSPSKACGLCGKNFWWPSDLARHVNTHSRKMLTLQSAASKELEGEGYDSPAQHTLSHLRGKQQIEASGHNSQVTEQSIVIHKPFLCDQCGQGFLWLSDLTQHWLAHSGKQLILEEQGQSNWGEDVPADNISGDYLEHFSPLGSGEPCRTFACQKSFECGECHFSIHTDPKALGSVTVWEIEVNGLHRPLFQMQPYESGYCETNDDSVNPQPPELSPFHADIKPSTELSPILSSCEAVSVEPTVPSTSSGLQRKASTEGISTSTEQPQAIVSQHPKVPQFLSTSSLLMERASSPVEGNKPFACPKCQKLFSSASYLSKHLLIHQTGKPYKCSTCGKAFAQRSYLAKHQEVHTVSLEHKCLVCGNFFTRSSYLKKHINRHRSSGQPILGAW